MFSIPQGYHFGTITSSSADLVLRRLGSEQGMFLLRFRPGDVLTISSACTDDVTVLFID